MINEPDIKVIEHAFSLLLEGLGLEWQSDPHMKDTPARAAKAWYHEICSGVTKSQPQITMFPSNDNNMVMLRDIPVMSICSHHLLPFIGKACVAYIPGGGQILGLSKLSRIVNWRARRPQVQESLTEQIADDIHNLLTSGASSSEGRSISTGVGVIIEARHMCMELRGVKHSSDMVTSSLRGAFLNTEMRTEFLSLAGAR